MEINPIAHIENDFVEKFGVPRQAGKVKNISKVIFEKEYAVPEAFKEIEKFSHLWLLFDFSLSHTDNFSPTVRPPRLGGNVRVGVFASRSPFRPNSIGISCVKLISVETSKENGTYLTVEGADLVNGTPIYDVKPYIPYSDIKTDATDGFTAQNKNYKLDVVFQNGTDILLGDKKQVIEEILSEDPRPSYKKDGDKIYKMKYSDFDISFLVKNKILYVKSVQKIK